MIEEHVLPVPSTDRLFNVYRDTRPDLDIPKAHLQRREQLKGYLSHYQQTPEVLLVAEAPGPWGCRFSGVPFTAEGQLIDPAFPLSGIQTSLREEPCQEYSANIVWGTLAPFFPKFFIWNSVPLHPHKPGKPMSIRTPGVREVRAFGPALAAIHSILRPSRVGAIGRKAEMLLKESRIDCVYVRHPSQGGANLFREGVLRLMGA